MSATPLVCAVDLSLTATGLAMADGTTKLLSTKYRGVQRLDSLRAQVMFGVQAQGRFIDLMVIEQYAFSRSGAHAHELGELGGVIRMALFENGVPFAEVQPSTLKKFATGVGNCDKSKMAVAAFKACGVEFDKDDRCDAWWLRQIGLYHLGAADVPQTAYRDQACSVVDWPAERPETVGSGW